MRWIGIRHRVKKTAKGEAQPTMVAILEDDGSEILYTLEDEQAELDFVHGMFPIAHRPVTPDEDIASYRRHHCKWRTLRKKEDRSEFPEHLLHERPDGKWEILLEVPTTFDGLHPADEVGMIMGGSGDRFAAALSRQGEDLGAAVYRIPPFVITEHRGDATVGDDHHTLARLVRFERHLFYRVERRDRDLIRVKEVFALRQDAQQTRKACGQRLDQRFIGRIFLSEEGRYPEGHIEDECDQLRASDGIFLSCLAAEAELDKELERAVHATSEWELIFEDIEGCGPRITAGLLAPIGPIRRFRVAPDFSGAQTLTERSRAAKKARDRGAAKLKAFCGAHVLNGGKHADVRPDKQFPRQRAGMVANWNPLARQSLYLVGEQFNRRPDSVWGKKLREIKARLRARHPEIMEVERTVDGKRKTVKMYTDGHIQKMALWRTLTRFVEWLFDALCRVADSPRPRPIETLR